MIHDFGESCSGETLDEISSKLGSLRRRALGKVYSIECRYIHVEGLIAAWTMEPISIAVRAFI